MIEALQTSVSINALIWLSLVMFVIHDLEEIIWVEPVLRKQKSHILKRIPKGFVSLYEDMLNMTSSQFAVAVLLEFIILTVITFSAAEYGKYFWFLAFISIFFIHVFTHVGQSLLLKIYTPGVVTAVVLVLPFTSYTLYRMIDESLVSWNEILISIPFGVLIVPIVLIGHYIGRKLIPN